MQKQRIAIAGSGVAGLTAALQLARSGHEVTVFEQSQSLGPVGAGVLLQPSGQIVLERLGLLAAATKHAERIDRLVAVTHRGKSLIDLPYGELFADCHAYGIHRGELFTTLHEAAVAAGVRFVLGCKVTGYSPTAAGVRLTADNGAVRDLGEFDFLIAADGARSVLRENSALAKRVHEYPHGALWAVAPCPEIRGELWQVTHGTRTLCGILPMGGTRASLFWSLRKDEKDGLFARGFEAWRAEVLGLAPPSRPFFEVVRTWEEVRFTTYLHVTMPRCYDERCIFLGDAAHAMSPHLGQGINLALLDGYLFARALAAAPDFPAACRAYEETRRAHLRVYAAVTRMLSPFFQSRGFIKAWGRDIFLPLMPMLPPLRRQMILTMAGLRASWLGGMLDVP